MQEPRLRGHLSWLLCLVAALVFAVAGCDDSEDPEEDTAVDMDPGDTDPGDTDPGDTDPGDTADMVEEPPEGVPPPDKDKMAEWLTTEAYKTWEAEPRIRYGVDDSPHGRVKTYHNTILVDSFTAGNAEHTKWSASVKELHDDTDVVVGHAVEVKTQDTSDGGDGWYWYISVPDKDTGVIVVNAGHGLTNCKGCHSGGTDFVTTRYPFEDVPPDEAGALKTWLDAGNYSGWESETAIHEDTSGTSPHGRVKVFHNPRLVQSFMDGNTEHTTGSCSVKELYDAADVLIGHAVEIKTQKKSDTSEGWYWFLDNGMAMMDGPDIEGCTNCHSSGTDHVTTPYPFTE